MVAETPIWRDRLTTEERAQLGRGAGTISLSRPDILVVGGGIAGVATAAACHDAGLGSVLLIEAGRLGSGATGGAAGLLTPEIHEWSDPEPFVELARTSLELWGELEQKWPGGVGLIELDWIGLAPDPDGFAPHQRPAVEWLDHDRVADLVPGLARPMAGALIRRQARVNPLRSLTRLAAVLPAVATGIAATSVTARGGRVTKVTTTAGDIHPGAVVFATGMAPAVPGLPELGVPQRWVKGHLAATVPAPFRLRTALAALEGLVLQLPGGEIVAGGTLDEGDDDPVVRDGVVEHIRAALGSLLPRTAELPTGHAWCCFRPTTADEQPVIDRVPETENAWLTCGHFRTGILMAAGTGDALARWIGTGAPPEGLEPFGLGRFAG